jgi:hypothetical protein
MSDENIIDAEFEEAAPVSDYQQNDRTNLYQTTNKMIEQRFLLLVKGMLVVR